MRLKEYKRYQYGSVWAIIVVVLFSVSLALGEWNPFASPAGIEQESSIGLSHITTFVLIAYLLSIHIKKFKSIFAGKYTRWLWLFFVALFTSSLFNASVLGTYFVMYFAKLFVCILLFSTLPELLVRYPGVVHVSFVSYMLATICIVLFLYMGLGQQFITVSNGRMFFFGENPNTTSARFGIAVVLIFYYIFENPLNFNKLRFLLIPSIFPLMLYIVYSGSRGSLLITAGIVFLYPFLMSQKNMKKSFVATLLVIISLAVYTFNSILNSEYGMLDRLNESAAEGGNEVRERLLSATLDVFLRNPIFGCGIVDLKQILIHEYHLENTAHNMYAYILATSGLVGATFFFIFLYLLLRDSFKTRKNGVIGLSLLTFIVFIAYKTGGILTYLFMWYIYTVSMAFVRISARGISMGNK